MPKFLAARAQPDGNVRTLHYEGGEPVDELLSGLESIGIDPDSLGALGNLDRSQLAKNRLAAVIDYALSDDFRADRHGTGEGERHPRTGQFQKKPPPDDEVDSAAAASVSSAPKALFNWRHGGASLFT